MLSLQHPLGDIGYINITISAGNLVGVYVKLFYRHLYITIIIHSKSPNGCSNDPVLLLKALLQWLANCSIKKSLF